MKKLLLTLVLITSINSFSQDYIPMLQEDNIWHIAFGQCCDSGGSFPYEIVETAVIEGVEYKAFDYFGNGCFFREDNGIVYKRGNGEDIVYLDFTLEVGDTIDSSIYQNDDCLGLENDVGLLTVVNADTQMIAGEMRRIISFDQDAYNGLPVQWIEGIGSLAGLYPFGFTIDISFELVCFTNGGVTTMFNGNDECNFLTVDEFLLSQIKMTPNPVTEIGILTIPQEIAFPNIVVFDVNGKQLMEKEISEKNTSLDFSSLASGMYFYSIHAENELILTKKLLVK